jgi:Fic family protein
LHYALESALYIGKKLSLTTKKLISNSNLHHSKDRQMTIPQETPFRIEPCLLDSIDPKTADLATDLAWKSGQLGEKLHEKTASNLSDLVRIANCYYSNLIEGHKTKPKDIERALAEDFDNEGRSRNLQVEARAHVRLQKRLDDSYLKGELPNPWTVDFIKDLHRDFYKDATEEMLLIQGNGHHFYMTPGEFRSVPEHDVEIGQHIPPSSTAVESFMRYFENRYCMEPMRMNSRIITMAAAHHRFNYIHPFPDGNGRVSRLMSHAMGLYAGIGANGLWSVSRGLSRGLEGGMTYKQMMNHADMKRQGDLDGRGNLSKRALTDFINWFIAVCIDQITFMSSLYDFGAMESRLEKFIVTHELRNESINILKYVWRNGEVSRGEALTVTGLGERTARSVLAALLEKGVLGSDTVKGPVSIRFPVESIDIFFPRLFSESAS